MSASTRTVTYTADELQSLTEAQYEELMNLLALPRAKVTATMVVRRVDGSIKYDEPDRAGSYGEEHVRHG